MPPVAGSSSNPGVSHEGVDAKLVYQLAIKARVFVFSLSLILPMAQFGLDSLRDLAYQNIKSSMSSENIVEELFSAFSAEYVHPFSQIRTNLATDIRHEPIREMQYQLLRREFWTADTQQDLRKKIEQFGGQTSHYGSTIAAVFRDLVQGGRAEGTAGVISQSSFHTEPDPSNPSITLKFKTITTAPALRNMSQEVCIPKIPHGCFVNRASFPGTPPDILSAKS